MTVRDHMGEEPFYAGLDAGIRFAVRVLHAAGIDTTECCQGGTGHAFDVPTVDMQAGDPALGFAALAALASYGLRVRDVSIVWLVVDGLPTERRWRITLRQSYPERADEAPAFVACYRATPQTGPTPGEAAALAERRAG